MKQSAVHLLDVILIVHHKNHQEKKQVDQAVLDKGDERKQANEIRDVCVVQY